MTEDQEKISLPREIPVFPLPNAILFPGVELPLFVFEPRYRTMLADVLQQKKFMGVSLFKPGWQETQEPYPAYETIGAGYVKVAVNHPDGTSHIVLKGVARARIQKYLTREPYPIAQIIPLESIEGDASQTDPFCKELFRRYQTIPPNDMLSQLQEIFEKQPSGFLADVVAFYSTLSLEQKQALLEELDVVQRFKLLLDALGGA